MIYFKSMLAGAVALSLVALAVSALALRTVHKAKNRFPDPPYFIEWHLHAWSILGGALLVFGLGFIWQFRGISSLSPR